jgi:hypothetical protein
MLTDRKEEASMTEAPGWPGGDGWSMRTDKENGFAGTKAELRSPVDTPGVERRIWIPRRIRGWEARK